MHKRKAKKRVGKTKTKSNLSFRVGFLVIIVLGILGYIFFQNKGWQTKLSPAPGTKVEKTVTATPAIEITGDTYTVKPGDALKDIARRAYGSEDAWVKIAQANNLKNPNRIEAGWVLRIPR